MAAAGFVFNGQQCRVVFGAGAIQHLEREIDVLKARRVLVLSTSGQADQAQAIADRLGPAAAGSFPHAVMHVPIEIAREACEAGRRLGADCLLAIGGGSTVGLAKAIALESGLPILAIPTTYAGSEMTPIYGITDGGIKKTGRDPRVLPRAVIYDPDLTMSLPVAISVTSGMNAIAHAAEGLYAQDTNPVMQLLAQEGIAAVARALPALRRNARDRGGRADALYGAWLCGMVLGNVGMALHHKLCHTLGGSFKLPHAEVHAILLPHAIAFNAPAVPEALRSIERALGAAAAAEGLFDLARDSGAPCSLKEIGMKAGDLDHAADLAVRQPYWNPRPIAQAQRPEIRKLLQDAYEGLRPT